MQKKKNWYLHKKKKKQTLHFRILISFNGIFLHTVSQRWSVCKCTLKPMLEHVWNRHSLLLDPCTEKQHFNWPALTNWPVKTKTDSWPVYTHTDLLYANPDWQMGLTFLRFVLTAFVFVFLVFMIVKAFSFFGLPFWFLFFPIFCGLAFSTQVFLH